MIRKIPQICLSGNLCGELPGRMGNCGILLLFEGMSSESLPPSVVCCLFWERSNMWMDLVGNSWQLFARVVQQPFWIFLCVVVEQITVLLVTERFDGEDSTAM